jgi:hypothetical protein
MIPWVFALLVLLGWSAVGGDRVLVRKNPCQDGAGLSQLADDLQAPRGVVNSTPFVGSTPDPFKAVDLSSLLLGIEVLREVPVVGNRGGAVQGRAPPVMRIS